MTTNKEKYSIIKDGQTLVSAQTEKLAWALCGAKNKKDREILIKLGFTLVENVDSPEISEENN
jgi:hypothetical protein